MVTGRNILEILRGVVQSYFFFFMRKNYSGEWRKIVDKPERLPQHK